MGQVQPEHRVPRLERREVDRRVRLGAGMGLHVGVVGVEQLLGAIAGDFLDLIDELAAGVIPPARIPLGVFVRQHAAHRLQDGRAGVVFAGDHFQAIALAADFADNGGPDLRVLAFQKIHGRSRGGQRRAKPSFSAGRGDSSTGRGKGAESP